MHFMGALKSHLQADFFLLTPPVIVESVTYVLGTGGRAANWTVALGVLAASSVAGSL